MADDDREQDPPEETPDDPDELRALPAVDVKAIYPGAYRDSITGEWILIEQPAPNGRRAQASGKSSTGLDRLRERLHTANAITDLPPLTSLVDGLLFLPGESVLYSTPKLAKTFWALDLALSVASGRQFHGRDVHQGPTLYVAAEGVGGMGARVGAWSEYVGETNLSNAYFLTTAVNLGDRKGMGALLELVDELRPVLTVFDTLARCTPGLDENAVQDMSKVVASLDAVRGRAGEANGGAHVMCIHHVGKDASKGMRGSSALLGAVDTTIELSGDARAIRCANTAQKDAEPVHDWWCSLEQVGSSAVIVPSGAAGGNVSNKLLESVLGALEELPPKDRTATNWKRNAEAAGIPERSFWRGKKWALDGGHVRVAGEGRGSLFEMLDDDPETDEQLGLEDAG